MQTLKLCKQEQHNQLTGRKEVKRQYHTERWVELDKTLVDSMIRPEYRIPYHTTQGADKQDGKQLQ